MMRELLILLLLLSSATAVAEPLVISEDMQCVDGEMVVDGDVTIKSGASLLLEDCTLIFDPPEYADEWIVYTGVQGVVLHVEDGASLEIRTVDGEAGMRPASLDYAYSLLVDGTLALTGKQGLPVVVSGLEGHIAEPNFDGGVKVRGTASMEYVRFDRNQGPAINANGGHVDAHHLLIQRNAGGVAAKEGSFVLRDSYINVGIIGIFATTSDITLDNVTVAASKPAVKVGRSDALITNSALFGLRGGIEAIDSNVTLLDSHIGYGEAGIAHDHRDSYEERARIVVRNSTLQAIQDKERSMALTTLHADVDVQDSVLQNYTGIGVNHGLGSIRLVNNSFEGNGTYHAYLSRPRAHEIHDNRLVGSARLDFVYAASMAIDVVDDDGPVPGATVRLSENEAYTTDENGTIAFVAHVPVDPLGTLLFDSINIQVEHGERAMPVNIPLEQQRTVVDMDPDSVGSPGLPLVAALVVLALVAGRRRR